MSYWNNLDRHEGGACIDDIWLSNTLVRAEVNRRVSGDPALGPTQWLLTQIRTPIARAVSIGCGTGAFERDVSRQNIVVRVTGVDVAASPLERARQLAAAEGLTSRIDYVQGDAIEFLRANVAQFDAVFFHASLHHFADPLKMLIAARHALKPRGYLYFDEYVGPSRDEWSWWRLLLPSLAYYAMPGRMRRPKIVRAPINREDPTEAIASSKIMPAVRALFPNVIEKPYGGNLLAIVYANLHRPPANGVSAETFERGVRRLIAFERMLMRLRAPSFYRAVLATREDRVPEPAPR